MNFEVPLNMKVMYVANIVLFITSLFLGNDTVLMGSVVIFVILSVSIEILEAIHDLKQT